MEEPRARIIREEPDRDIITGVAHAHDVAVDRVIIVVRGITRTAYNSERMPMQVHGMLFGVRSSKLMRTCRKMPAQNTHRSGKDTSRYGQFDALVCLETVDAACGNHVQRILRTAHDLEQHRDRRWHEASSIDDESRGSCTLAFRVR